MKFSIHDDNLDAAKARILLEATVKLIHAGVKQSFYIRKMLWAISLYLECGNYKEDWKTYPRVSDAARKIRGSGDRNWRKLVTFEHARPLKQIYEMLNAEGTSLTVDKAASIIGEYAPVLITREENGLMNKRGYKSKGDPEARYQHIQFSGFTLRSTPNNV
ncbi:hypothetical protein JQ617_02710 [Bradyrhizobium sp. KB893862 SZCCT0404]|uniref:hypothetical protein n=1 Tax=Bradyrhizobium sp. KB893862 SZCCT0404 TaxID=2807672 RepID=UPI001BA81F6B|nr:hypothetical protein [Bradyrhizobium sp. KB893862 SZCCT0404]MBR1172854.1 hypothetical protein [Bradyrhizobium sp. KB893862 SZCCT0404]